MKALLSRAAGGPETFVVTDVPEPVKPGVEEILLCVNAAKCLLCVVQSPGGKR